MRIIIFPFLTMIFLFASFFDNSPLEKYQWKNRLLVVFTPSENSDLLTQQLELWQNAQDGLEERDLLYWIVTPDKVVSPDGQSYSPQKFHSYWKVEDKKFEVLLIGKDGGVKLRQNELLQNAKLFAIIDAMPMRKREMEK
jgi:hypothetical protein